MIAINEHSLLSQCASDHEVLQRMRLLKDVIEALKAMKNPSQIAASSTLYACELEPGVTFHSWVHQTNNGDRDLRLYFIIAVKNGPFIDHEMRNQGISCSCACGAMDMAYSSASGAAHFDGVVVSWKDAGQMSSPIITLQNCAISEVGVANYSDLSQVRAVDRIYSPTVKHRPHGWGTPMDLDDAVAQQTLRDGYSVGGNVYGKVGEKFYIFRSDNIGGFHGYPISRFDVPNKAQQFLERAESSSN